jgi:hypothetical protein
MRKYCWLLAIWILLLSFIIQAANEVHVMAVTVLTAKLAEKTVFIRDLNGKQETILFTKDTPITSIAEAAISGNLHGGVGYQFLIHYSFNKGTKIANRFDFVGREEWKTLRGNLQKVELSQRNMVVTDANGIAVTYLAGKYCSVETSTGARSFAEWVSSNPEAGAEIIVRFIEVKDKKIAHLIEMNL